MYFKENSSAGTTPKIPPPTGLRARRKLGSFLTLTIDFKVY